MIWFACSKCAKVHGRPDNAVGAMIFCDCGQGLSVPWESTAPEPAQLPSARAEPIGRVEPLSFDAPAKVEPRDILPPPRQGRRGTRYQHDPNVCFNHEARAKQKMCDECELPFCDDCVVTFRGQTLCGPCKNYEAKLLQRPPRTHGLATTSVLVALAALPLLFLLMLGRSPWFTILTLVPLGAALAAGIVALCRTQSDPRVGGQALAITGIVTASFVAVLAVVMALVIPRLAA